MKAYKITIDYNAPYPISTEFVIQANNFAIATGRALRKFRTENVKGKRIKTFSLRLDDLGKNEMEASHSLIYGTKTEQKEAKEERAEEHTLLYADDNGNVYDQDKKIIGEPNETADEEPRVDKMTNVKDVCQCLGGYIKEDRTCSKCNYQFE